MNFLSRLFTALLLSLLMIPDALAEFGGITGGGGGTTNPNPIGVENIGPLLPDLKFMLRSYLQFQKWHWYVARAYSQPTNVQQQFLFERNDDVFQYLDKAELEVWLNGPCKISLQ